MKHTLLTFILPVALCSPPMLQAQAPVKADSDHARLLASSDARLAANKRLVYDFWREVMEAGRADLAAKYVAESYIQHDPTQPSGRAAFASALAKSAQPKAVEPRVKASLVTVAAEGDMVILCFVAEGPDPGDATKTFTTTWFDMFRVQEGKIAEHWDAAPLDAVARLHRSSR